MTTDHTTAIYADHNVHGWHAIDPAGGYWWPDEDAADEIAASDKPADHTRHLCETAPMRGEWRT